jgi:hypothetical protein
MAACRHFLKDISQRVDLTVFFLNFLQLADFQHETFLNYVYNLMLRFPKFYRFWLGPFRVIVSLFHPDCIRVVLKSSGTLKCFNHFAV